jgi:hypothetical protein
VRSASMEEVRRVYGCGSGGGTTYARLDCPELQTFCFALQRFERALGEERTHDFWAPYLRRLKRLRFQLCSTVLPFNHSQIAPDGLTGFLDTHLLYCRRTYPRLYESESDLNRMVVSLTGRERSPALDELRRLIVGTGKSRCAVLCADGRTAEAVERYLHEDRTFAGVRVLTAAHLRGNSQYRHLFVIGPSRWYPDYILTAP